MGGRDVNYYSTCDMSISFSWRQIWGLKLLLFTLSNHSRKLLPSKNQDFEKVFSVNFLHKMKFAKLKSANLETRESFFPRKFLPLKYVTKSGFLEKTMDFPEMLSEVLETWNLVWFYIMIFSKTCFGSFSYLAGPNLVIF